MQEQGPAEPGIVEGAEFDIVAIATSAGGLKALEAILSTLDPRFPVPIVVVQHLSRTRKSIMAQILSHITPLEVKQAEDGERMAGGCIYTGPSDHHFLVKPDGTISLTDTDLVHFVRPSADLLFESVAAAYGSRAIAVVATGSGFDGATGVRAIKRRGGKVIVQDELSSEFFGMPGAAINTGAADLILPLTEIGPALNRLVLVI